MSEQGGEKSTDANIGVGEARIEKLAMNWLDDPREPHWRSLTRRSGAAWPGQDQPSHIGRRGPLTTPFRVTSFERSGPVGSGSRSRRRVLCARPDHPGRTVRPSGTNTAHFIALRRGPKPWQGTDFYFLAYENFKTVPEWCNT